MDEKFQNQLGEEKSAYLLKHANNPIHWHAWDEEAFRDSIRFDKPIFLSIGYTACHYCHLMEKESFSDDEVAEVFNRAFICIKVDAEELVTVDRTYMKFAEALMNSSGGWPLNLFLTPTRMPFYAVTYLPKHSSQGLTGIIELGEHIESVWQSDEREMLYEHATSVIDFFRDQAVYKGDELFDEGDVHRGIATFFEGADALFGGMKRDPKFILNYELETLMKYGALKEEGRCEYFVRLTLDKMRAGGVYDQICGGFARYATDPRWKIPHFEKILIDNVWMGSCYLEAYSRYKDESYKKTAEEIFTFIKRDLYVEGEGFYQSINADKDGVEGKEFTFSYEEIDNLFSGEDKEVVCKHFGITEKGNFEGRNVLAIEDQQALPEHLQKKLFDERMKRRTSHGDHKMVTSANAHALCSLIKAAKVLEEPEYFTLAVKILGFVENHLVRGDRLARRYCDGEVKYDGIFDDYAAMISAYLAFYDYTGDATYLERAEAFTESAEALFGLKDGPFSDVAENLTLFFTRCDLADRREPASNSIHMRNLLTLWEITGEDAYLKRAEDIMKCVKKNEGEVISSMFVLNVVIDFLEKKESSC